MQSFVLKTWQNYENTDNYYIIITEYSSAEQPPNQPKALYMKHENTQPRNEWTTAGEVDKIEQI